MAKLVTYRCPDCKGEFDFLHHPADEPPPDRCELCGSFMGDSPERAPVLRLNYGKEKNRVPDQLYRRLETDSHVRMEAAAEMSGGSASDHNVLKMTDMKDNLRAGDNTSKINTNEAMKRLSTQHAKPELQNPNAAAWIGETTAGPGALATRAVMESMPHQNIIAAHTRAGNDGKRH